MFALAGYAELLLAEDVCAGVPLSAMGPSGELRYGSSLTTTQLLDTAITHFDSALAHATDSLRIANLAAVGKGRALVALGQFSGALTAVAAVPGTFRYETQVQNQPTYGVFYAMSFVRSVLTIADSKGGNGLNYVSAHDPRLPITVLGTLRYTGAPLNYSTALGVVGSTTDSIAAASGREASLIRAETLLPVNGGSGSAWLDTLNALRAAFPDTALSNHPLSDPGTDDARVDLLFRERAFWLFGTGHRLADLRRLVHVYGRDQATVFPTGPYVNGTIIQPGEPTTYGSDVNFPLGDVERANPNFHGCLDRHA
jgi:starch-binding outer membrane protein, SusD/RagB family